jgi:uncharacterized protein YkwD
LLVGLLIIILIILNGIGVFIYRKKRQQFVNKSNKINDNIPMSEISTISAMNINKSKYRQMSTVLTGTSDLSYENTSNYRSSFITNPEETMVSIPNITTIYETDETSQSEPFSPSNQTNDKSDMDLLLEEFQRQALKEHNSVRKMYNKPPFRLSESLNIYAQVKFKSFVFYL